MSNLAYSLEQDLLARKNQALDLLHQGYATDPLTLGRLMGIARTWPMIRPGVALSLSQDGYDRTSPEVKDAAQLSTKQALNEQAWHASFGLNKIPAIPAQQGGGLKGLSTGQLFSLYQNFRQDSARVNEGKMDSGAYQKRWGVDGEYDAEGVARIGRSLAYALGQRKPGDVKSLFDDANLPRQTDETNGGKSISAYQGFKIDLAAVREESSIAQDMKSVSSSLPIQALQTVTREAGAVANMPLQGVQGAIRDVASGKSLFNVGAQTDIGQQYANALGGKSTDIGNGWLPDPHSPVAQQALQAQQAAAPLIGGHAFTLGRYTANQLFEPDTNAFNILSGIVDAGVAIKGDPAALAIGGAADIRDASKTFDPATVNTLSAETGLYPTTSRVVLDQNTKANYLAGPGFEDDMNHIFDAAGSDGNTSRMMRVLNKNPALPTFPITTVHGQALVSDLAEAAKTRDLDAARTALAQATEVTSALDPPGVTYKLRQGADARLFASMPQGSLADVYDKNANWKILDDVMRGGNVPVAARDDALHTYITNSSPMAGIDAVQDTIKQTLIHRYGVDEATASARSSFFRDAHTSARAYDIDQATGIERVRPGIGIAGTAHPVPAPSLSTEGLNSPIMLPNQRELRRSASDFNYLTGTKPWDVSQAMLAYPATLWKPLQVLTGRMATRIVGETQLNMAARGMINAFTHPLHTISLLIGTNQDSRWANLLDKIPGLDGSFMVSPDGRSIIDDSENMLMHTSAFIHDPWTVATKGWMTVPPNDARAGEGLAESLARMHGDPIMRGVSLADTPQAAKDWFWDGAGKDLRLARAPITSGEDAYNAQKLAAGKLTSYPVIGDIANDRAAADNYIDKVMYPKLVDMTGGGHPDLLGAVQTGKLNGRPIYTVTGGRPDLTVVDQRAASFAKDLLDAGHGPQNAIPVRELANVDPSTASEAAAYGKRAIDAMFHGLVDVPDKVLNRQPVFAQLQWQHAEDLAPYLRDEDLPKLIANAETANLPKAQLARIRNIALDQTSSDRLTLDQLTKAAKIRAADDAKYIVHDLTSRSQFFDMVRFLVPFGDAFRLIATRMAKLAIDEPQVLRRVQQGVQELTSPGSSTVNRLLGDPVAPGQGFFHDDPSTGQSMFTYPGSTWIDQSLLGVPIPLQGQVSGLNMIGEGYPGLGSPVATIPAKWFLPDTPTGNSIRDIIFPYGTTPSQGIGADIGESFVPAWLNKVSRGLSNTIDQRSFNSMTLQVMQTLFSQGGYDARNPDDLARLANDAKTDARWLYVIRGAAQFVSPGAPTPNFQIADKSGHLMETYLVSKAYREHQAKDGGDKAFKWLLDTFGTKNIFVSQSASAPTSYAAPVNQKAQAWVDAHPGIAEKYPLTYGLFAPASNDFSQDVYSEQFAKGERRTLSPKEQIAQAENRLGFYAYNLKKSQILKANDGANFDRGQQEWLRKYRTYLAEQFPGFDTFLASPYDSQKRRNAAIAELQAAVKDRDVLGTDAGQGLKQYLGYRAQAIKSALDGGLTSQTSVFQAKRAAPLREWLRSGADAAATDHPSFRSLWEQIFAHEFTTQGR